jgi:hypothetical protein
MLWEWELLAWVLIIPVLITLLLAALCLIAIFLVAAFTGVSYLISICRRRRSIRPCNALRELEAGGQPEEPKRTERKLNFERWRYDMFHTMRWNLKS